ncbi:hypothetical protein ACHQM5_018100 [Ranunculus cassubicifolius]
MPNTRDPIACASSGDVDYFEGVDMDVIEKARDEHGNSALSIAAMYAQLRCCEVIYKRCPQLLYEADSNGFTALHQSAYNGRDEVIKFLLTASAKLQQEMKDVENRLLMMVSNSKDTALHSAAKMGHLQSAKLLVDADPSKKLLRMVEDRKGTALHVAVSNHHLEIVKLLVEADPDFEYSASDFGVTPLYIALEEASSGDQKKAEIRKFLIEKQPAQCRLPTGVNEWTLIHHATHRGDLSAVKDIVHFWPDCCEWVDKEGQNCLHLAVKFEQVTVLNYLLELNIDENVLNATDNYGNSPLHLAMSTGNQSIALALLNDPRVNKMGENREGIKALDMASRVLLGALIKSMYPIECARKGDVDFFRVIHIDVLRKSVDEYGDSVLSTAVRNGRLKCCEVIYERCPELLYQTNKNGVSTLHTAALNGKDEIIKFLLSALGKTDQQGRWDIVDYKLLMMASNNQQTALHFAVDNGHSQSAKLLILGDPSNKLSKMVDNKKETALHYAVKKHNLEIVKLLVEIDPDFDYPANDSGHTPLFMALQEALLADHITVEIRKLLIQKQPRQCKVRIGTNGWTILQHATIQGDPSVVKEILQSCPDCSELVDNEGRNFLHLAIMFDHENVVKIILGSLDTGDDVLNGQDINGDTPLHIATLKGSESIAKLLLYDSRVNKMVQNRQGKKALDAIKFEYDKRRARVLGLIDLVDEKDLKDRSDFDLLVGALISTVSFTAGITVPGGFNSDGRDKGTAILHKKGTFVAFVAFNTIALALSLFAVFIHFCMRHLVDEKEIAFQLKVATICSIGAIFAMMVAFITGSLAVLSTSLSLILIVCVICSTFFLSAFYFLWRMRRQQKRRRPM